MRKLLAKAADADGDKWARRGRHALPILCVLCGFAVSSAAFSATTWSQTWNVSTAIPDNADVGITDTRFNWSRKCPLRPATVRPGGGATYSIVSDPAITV